MAQAIRSYMDETTSAFQFDEALSDIAASTKDETVVSVRHHLWFFYDDVKDHKVVAGKEEWAYFNRLLLLLQSEGTIEVVKTSRHWHFRQAVAAASLIGFGLVVLQTGFGQHLFTYAVPFGVVSMILAWFNARQQRKSITAEDLATAPFPSVGSLLSVRRSVSGFTKARYPLAIAGRRIRDPFLDKINRVLQGVMWLMFSPVPLFFQMLPERACESRIRVPESVAVG